MRKRTPKTYLAMLGFLFLLLSLSAAISEKIRTKAMDLLSPGLSALRGINQHDPRDEEVQRLRLQNQLLAAENHKMRELLQADWGGFDAQDDVAAAQVIFRAPMTWNSYLWINAGKEENRKLGKNIIAKNSPVLYGRSLVGVIDYVGDRQSRVHLITDTRLTPAVRAMRFIGKQAHLLAKGELHGNSKPIGRKESLLLKGIGFNYDFEDGEGPARDLRSGGSLDPARPARSMPIIQVNDLLVTTGLDGVFPKGLEVAIVTKVSPLKEGDYSYEIEARPTARELDRLSYVFIIPPTGFDPEDQP
ncbi:MAG: hypothetical protein LLG04_06700 [Parachlamydia sp.]|nr:hypothetical protein [Parachlamydia sp.]